LRKIDVGELVNECVNLTRVRHNLAAEAVTFSESSNGERPGERPQVKADADELRVAISNLLDNAVKYSVKGVEISVEVAALDAKKVAVRIEDKGIGIPAAQLK